MLFVEAFYKETLLGMSQITPTINMFSTTKVRIVSSLWKYMNVFKTIIKKYLSFKLPKREAVDSFIYQ